MSSMGQELEDGGCRYLSSLFHLCLFAPNTGRKTLSPWALVATLPHPTDRPGPPAAILQTDIARSNPPSYDPIRIAPCDLGLSGHAAQMSTGCDGAVLAETGPTFDPCFS